MKKAIWFPVMILSIPLDIVLWNLLFGFAFGFRSPKQCLQDNLVQWKNLGTDRGKPTPDKGLFYE